MGKFDLFSGCAGMMSHTVVKEKPGGPGSVDNRPPLWRALHRKEEKAVANLLAKGVDANERDGDGNTPLLHVSKEGHYKYPPQNIPLALVKGGAMLEAVDNEGYTALQISLIRGWHRTAALLLTHGANRSDIPRIRGMITSAESETEEAEAEAEEAEAEAEEAEAEAEVAEAEAEAEEAEALRDCCLFRPTPIENSMDASSRRSDDVVIVAAVRTPLGAFQGAFASLTAPDLGGFAIRGERALDRSGIQAGNIDEVYFGNVCSAGVGQAPATQAATKAVACSSVAVHNYKVR
eukprot:gene25351-11011_t